MYAPVSVKLQPQRAHRAVAPPAPRRNAHPTGRPEAARIRWAGRCVLSVNRATPMENVLRLFVLYTALCAASVAAAAPAIEWA